MMKIFNAILLFTIFMSKGTTAATVSCPTGYDNLFGDKCYKAYMEQHDWKTARRVCQADGGDLVSIHSEEESDALRSGIGGCCDFWTGLRCNATSFELYWSDGTPVTYTNYGTQGKQCDPAEGFFLLITSGEWYSENLDDPAFYIICEIDNAITTTVATTTARVLPASECGFGYQPVDEQTGVCVRIGEMLTTWGEANADCQLDGGDLAAIHRPETNDYIRRRALSERLTNAVFIGFQLQNDSGTWTDGSVVDYTNFDQGMPNAIFGACAAMQTGNLGGQWTSISCQDGSRLPYACTKPKPCPSTNTFTVEGEFSSPEYPSSRSSGLSCEYFIGASPGSLVLLRFDEFQLVDGDQVILYEGEGTEDPLAVVTAAAPTDRFMTKTKNVMRVVHLTGSGTGVRKWHATFASF